MKEIPEGLKPYKKTPVFDENTVPKALLNDHHTKKDVWGKINIIEGELIYTIKTNPVETVLLDKEKCGVVEPEMLHNVVPKGAAKFYVEFYK